MKGCTPSAAWKTRVLGKRNRWVLLLYAETLERIVSAKESESFRKRCQVKCSGWCSHDGWSFTHGHADLFLADAYAGRLT